MADEIQCVSCGLRFPPQNDHQGKMVLCPHCRRPTRNEPAVALPAAANPYAAPQAATPPLIADPHQASPVDSPEVYRALAGTRPWALFLGILGFIVSGIGSFWAIGAAIFEGTLRQGPEIFFVRFALVVLVAVLVAFGSWFPFRYGRRIGVFLKTQDLHDLDRALLCQRAFWQMAGIVAGAMAIVLTVLALLMG